MNVTCSVMTGSRETELPSSQSQCHCKVEGLLEDALSPSPFLRLFKIGLALQQWTCRTRMSPVFKWEMKSTELLFKYVVDGILWLYWKLWRAKMATTIVLIKIIILILLSLKWAWIIILWRLKLVFMVPNMQLRAKKTRTTEIGIYMKETPHLVLLPFCWTWNGNKRMVNARLPDMIKIL